MGVVRLPGRPPTQCLSRTGPSPQLSRWPTATIARVSEVVHPDPGVHRRKPSRTQPVPDPTGGWPRCPASGRGTAHRRAAHRTPWRAVPRRGGWFRMEAGGAPALASGSSTRPRRAPLRPRPPNRRRRRSASPPACVRQCPSAAGSSRQSLQRGRRHSRGACTRRAAGRCRCPHG